MGKVEHDSTYDAAAPALLKMERAAIASASHITYQPTELLALIKDHLTAAGLSETAAVLERETAHQEHSALAGLQSSQNAFPGDSGIIGESGIIHWWCRFLEKRVHCGFRCSTSHPSFWLNFL
jgi:hypothetical protein